ncbi:MAG: MaoC family dehydratase [Deltaproteobacteria bacterium]|nr:MaoC family dehydratase [Deltaproteobacteria bacterium]
MTSKTNSGNFFEDFELGAELVHPIPRTVTEGDQALYIALTGDRSPLSCSRPLARELGYAREPVHDLLVFHMVFGKTVGDVSLNAVANLGYADGRFLAPVYPGDTLRSSSTVIGRKQNSSGKTGVVWVRTRGENQRGEAVLEYTRWVMVNKRSPQSPEGERLIPELPSRVAPEDLVLPDFVKTADFPAWTTGGRAFFDDYEVGELIDHVDGMTIEESEHALATRLYQNTAKVHFDAVKTKDTRFGRRLMYGGHVISVAKALSFNGLENALGVLAINGGTHAAPCFAGDTVYARSELIEKAELPGRSDVGALRLRLLAVKDVDPASEPFEARVERDGKQRYAPSVLLDLDLWVWMPKRPSA